jgi:replication factor C large subunit
MNARALSVTMTARTDGERDDSAASHELQAQARALRSSASMPWTAKYAPTSPDEMTAQRAAIEQLRMFVKARKPGSLALLHGPQGSGKTSMVHALARSLGMELLEVNASDVRNERSILETLGPALKNQSLFGAGKLILFDEVDGLSGHGDRGGLGALLSLAAETTFPIVATANDPWDSKFNELRKRSVLIPVKGVAYTAIVPVLRRIATAEGLDYSDEALQVLARRAGGDIRAAITDLQTLGSFIDVARVETVEQRDVTGNIIDAVRVVLKTRDPKTARDMLDNLSEDIDEIFLWMDENLPKEYRKPEDLLRGYQAIATADRFRGRIRKWQHWRFLVYCYDLLGPGVALSKSEKYDGFLQVARTQRLLSVWRSKSAKRDSIIAKLATNQHISKKQARREFRILRPVLARAEFLEDEERAWLAEKKRS